MNTTTFIDNAVQGATAYWYRVRMYNDGGDSPYSNVASVTTPNPPVPTTPTGLTATSISTSQISLSWTNTNGVQTGVSIQRKGGANPNWADVGSVSGTATAWTDSSLASQTTYTYQIRATNVSGASGWAGPASATTGIAITGSGTFSISVFATSPNRIAVYWKSVSGASAYNVYRGTAPGGQYTRINPSPSLPTDTGPGVQSGLMYVDNGVSTGVTYYYRVIAVSSGGAETSVSAEDEDVPSYTSVPWDTGNAAAILAKAKQNMQSDGNGWGFASDSTVGAFGPNGVYYGTNTGTAQTFAADDHANASGDAFGSDGRPFPWTFDNQTPSPDYIGYNKTVPASGPYRKVESKTGAHTSFSATVQFPAVSGLNYLSGARSTASIYTGGSVGQRGIDAGFTRGLTDMPGWSLIVEHRSTEDTDKDPVTGKPALKSDNLPFSQDVWFKDGAVLEIHIGQGRTKEMYVHAADWMNRRLLLKNVGSSTPHVTLYFAANLKTSKRGQTIIKRVNSIAQSFKDANHPNAPALTAWNGPQGGLYMDSAKTIGAAWTNIQLDGSPWGVDRIANAGSYPGGPYVTWHSDTFDLNPEDMIVVQTSP